MSAFYSMCFAKYCGRKKRAGELVEGVFILLGCVVVLRASSPVTSSFWHVGVCCWYSSYPKHDDDGDDVSGT